MISWPEIGWPKCKWTQEYVNSKISTESNSQTLYDIYNDTMHSLNGYVATAGRAKRTE